MNHNLTRFSINPLVLAISMASPVVMADDGFVIEEVIVTAQKREQSLQDVPLSVQALGSDQLKQNSVSQLSDISALTPGFSVANQQDGGSISIRGVSTLVIGTGFDDSAPTYLDGVFLDNSLVLRELADIERIEVLRGPQGTLFGRNAAAGAVNVTTVAPKDEFEASVEVGYGSEDLATVKGIINIPLSDSVRLRASAAGRNRDGWLDSTNGGSDLYSQDHSAFRARLAWDISDSVSADFSADYYNQNDLQGVDVVERGSGVSPIGFGTISPTGDIDDESLPTPRDPTTGQPIDPDNNAEVYGLAATFNIELADNLSLLSVTSFRKTDNDIVTNFIGAVDPTDAFTAISSNTDVNTDTYSQEFRLSGTSDSLDWFVGLNYYYQDTEFVETVIASAGFGNVGDQGGSTTETFSGALFGDVIFRLSDRLNLTVGARYSNDKKEIEYADTNVADFFNTLGAVVVDGQVLNFDLDPSSPTAGSLIGTFDSDVEADWDDLSGRIVLDYQVTDDALVFAGVSTGYKSGGFNNALGNGQETDDPVDKETAINYEIGAKTTWMDGRLRANGSVFFTDYNDFQTQGTLPGQFAAVNLTADADILGAELDATFYATENLSFTLAVGYLDTEYTDDVSAGPGGSLVLEEGQSLVRAPDFTTTLSTNYLLPLGDAGNLRFNATYSYTESQRLTNDPADTLNGAVLDGIAVVNAGAGFTLIDPATAFTFDDSDLESGSFGVLNARVTYTPTSEKWGVSVWATNLTDEAYRDNAGAIIFNSLLNLQAQALTGFTRNEPRMVGVEFTYNFGS